MGQPVLAHLINSDNDKQADDIIGTLREIWSENWRPRMTDYLRGALAALAVSEVGRRTRAAWLANVNALFVFRCGAEDAEVMARELCVGAVDRLIVTAADIVGLADFACFARVRDGAGGKRHRQ